jgi:hypothetical protein
MIRLLRDEFRLAARAGTTGQATAWNAASVVPQNCYCHFINEFDTTDPGEFILEASLALLP